MFPTTTSASASSSRQPPPVPPKPLKSPKLERTANSASSIHQSSTTARLPASTQECNSGLQKVLNLLGSQYGVAPSEIKYSTLSWDDKMKEQFSQMFQSSTNSTHK